MADATRQVGKIVSRIGRNYLLEQDSGGKFAAESHVQWPVGARVIVVGGVIVDRAGVERNIKFYQV